MSETDELEEECKDVFIPLTSKLRGERQPGAMLMGNVIDASLTDCSLTEGQSGVPCLDTEVTEDDSNSTDCSVTERQPGAMLMGNVIDASLTDCSLTERQSGVPCLDTEVTEDDSNLSDCSETVPIQHPETSRLKPAASCEPYTSKSVGGIKYGAAKCKPKPDRYCIYCKKTVKGGKLSRHIKRNHKMNTEVAEIMKQPKCIQHQFFDRKRREGIYEFNMKALLQDKEHLMWEKKPKLEYNVRVCSECNSFLSNKYFSKHKCVTKDKFSIKLKNKTTMDNDEEFTTILNKFRDGEIGDLCRTDCTIKTVGYRHFCLRRHEQSKQVELRREVMNEMRILARLLLVFRTLVEETVSVESMFSRMYLSELREAIDILSSREEPCEDLTKREKHGLKLLIDAVILSSIKSLIGYYSETMQDEKYKELKMFRVGYKHKSPEMFSGASHQCNNNSMEKSRHPQNALKEWEVKKLKNFICGQLVETVENFTIKKYKWLRTLLVGRLTLFNARIGEEPSRMTCKAFQEAIDDTWLPPDEVERIENEAEKYLVGQFYLAFLKGKGKKYVPILIPKDLLPRLKLILEKREQYGIKRNIFLFGTRLSVSHASGWHASNDICREAQVDIPVTATKVRHWLSTIYASLDMNPQQQQIFLDHMGHDRPINKDNYQTPLGVRHVKVMGQMLNSVESGAKPKTKLSGDELAMLDQPAMEAKRMEISEESDSEVRKVFKTSKQKEVGVKWSQKDTKRLRQAFSNCVYANVHSNQGGLPSKEEIPNFLEKEKPDSLHGLNMTL